MDACRSRIRIAASGRAEGTRDQQRPEQGPLYIASHARWDWGDSARNTIMTMLGIYMRAGVKMQTGAAHRLGEDVTMKARRAMQGETGEHPSCSEANGHTIRGGSPCRA
jgi:hypothetical protein